MKKCLAVGIILFFLSTACLPVIADDGKPDLYVNNVGTYRDNEFPPVKYFFVFEICNSGNASANGTLNINFTAQRFLFGILPIKSITIEYSDYIDFDFYPGCHCWYAILYRPIQFGFGLFKINCTVNPDKNIEETNYNNNYYEHKYLALPLGWIRIK